MPTRCAAEFSQPSTCFVYSCLTKQCMSNNFKPKAIWQPECSTMHYFHIGQCLSPNISPKGKLAARRAISQIEYEAGHCFSPKVIHGHLPARTGHLPARNYANAGASSNPKCCQSVGISSPIPHPHYASAMA